MWANNLTRTASVFPGRFFKPTLDGLKNNDADRSCSRAILDISLALCVRSSKQQQKSRGCTNEYRVAGHGRLFNVTRHTALSVV